MNSLRLGQEKLLVVCGVVVKDGRIDGDGKSAEVIAIQSYLCLKSERLNKTPA
jgi:hypothetical protein